MIQSVEEFILKIVRNYPNWAKQRDPQYLIADYSLVIRDDWDLDELYRLFIIEWDKTSHPPMPAWFKQFADKVQKSKYIKPFSADKMADLKKISDWYCSDEWQWHRKNPPDHICMLIRKNRFTADDIDRMMRGVYEEYA